MFIAGIFIVSLSASKGKRFGDFRRRAVASEPASERLQFVTAARFAATGGAAIVGMRAPCALSVRPRTTPTCGRRFHDARGRDSSCHPKHVDSVMPGASA